MKIVLLIVFAFILGSIPFGVIIARIKGVDLKGVGSGNIGATNVLRALGKKAALITLSGDLAKGALPVGIIKVLSNFGFFPELDSGLDFGFLQSAIEGLMGISAIVGHNFSVFLRFKGGKGVATSIGVLLIYSPKIAILTLMIWLLVVLITRLSSLGALVSFGLLPVNVFLFNRPKTELIIASMITLLILLRHLGNIERIIKGTERKIGEQS